MYSNILAAIQHIEKIDNPEQYLQSLQPYVRQLRNSYCSSTVTVNYSDFNTQAAYLLAYYPQYAEMTYRYIKDIVYLLAIACWAIGSVAEIMLPDFHSQILGEAIAGLGD